MARGGSRGGTSTRGHKGAQSRSGYKSKRAFEGGQMPLQRRIPMCGFKNRNRVSYKAINLSVLEALAKKTNITEMGRDFFIQNGLISKKHKYKILGTGEVNTALQVHAHAFSQLAKDSLEKVGGIAKLLA